MRPTSFDHVALWTSARDEIADALARELGLRTIERTERFTLVGADARRGKLTLFEAEGPREPGPLVHVAFRASGGGGRALELPDGLRVLVVDGEPDLDHVALRSGDPEAAAAAYELLGFRRAGPARVEVGGAFVELVADGTSGEPAAPLLNHLGVLVDSVDESVAAAEERGLEIDRVLDAANTRSLFVWGPDRVQVEYVEHKPTFSLA